MHSTNDKLSAEVQTKRFDYLSASIALYLFKFSNNEPIGLSQELIIPCYALEIHAWLVSSM